jgi:hypothetical protein
VRQRAAPSLPGLDPPPKANAATHPLLHSSTPQQLIIILSLAPPPRSTPVSTAKIIIEGTDEDKWESQDLCKALGYASIGLMKDDIERAKRRR